MSFALVTDDVLVTWEDGKVRASLPRRLWTPSLRSAEGRWPRPRPAPGSSEGTPEAAYLALRKLWPHSEVEGDPPKIGPYGDELEGTEPIEEADMTRTTRRSCTRVTAEAAGARRTWLRGDDPPHDEHEGVIRRNASRRAERGHDPLPRLHYVGFDQMVLKHGLLFKHGPNVTPTEREYSATTPKQCFLNATHAALEHRDLTYVEGFAYNGILPIHHAWLVDEDGVVHDPTWASMQGREGEEDIYIGIPFKTDWLLRHLAEKETYGVYGEWGEGLNSRSRSPRMPSRRASRACRCPRRCTTRTRRSWAGWRRRG